MDYKNFSNYLLENDLFVSIFTSKPFKEWLNDDINKLLSVIDNIDSNEYYNDFINSEDNDKNNQLINRIINQLINKYMESIYHSLLSNIRAPSTIDTFKKVLSDIISKHRNTEMTKMAQYILSLDGSKYIGAAYNKLGMLCKKNYKKDKPIKVKTIKDSERQSKDSERQSKDSERQSKDSEKESENENKFSFRKIMFDKPENITTWDKFNSFCKQTVYIDTKFINNFIESIKGKTKAISSDDMLDSIQILLKNMNKEIEIDSIKENKGLLLYCFIPIIEFYEKQGF